MICIFKTLYHRRTKIIHITIITIPDSKKIVMDIFKKKKKKMKMRIVVANIIKKG